MNSLSHSNEAKSEWDAIDRDLLKWGIPKIGGAVAGGGLVTGHFSPAFAASGFVVAGLSEIIQAEMKGGDEEAGVSKKGADVRVDRARKKVDGKLSLERDDPLFFAGRRMEKPHTNAHRICLSCPPCPLWNQ
jgi:hypothetical protein